MAMFRRNLLSPPLSWRWRQQVLSKLGNLKSSALIWLKGINLGSLAFRVIFDFFNLITDLTQFKIKFKIYIWKEADFVMDIVLLEINLLTPRFNSWDQERKNTCSLGYTESGCFADVTIRKNLAKRNSKGFLQSPYFYDSNFPGYINKAPTCVL